MGTLTLLISPGTEKLLDERGLARVVSFLLFDSESGCFDCSR